MTGFLNIDPPPPIKKSDKTLNPTIFKNKVPIFQWVGTLF